MARVLKTTKDGLKKHYHVVYLNDEAESGFIAPAKDHEHAVRWVPPVTEQRTDPDLGEVETITLQEGRWVVEPAEDGHTHDLEDYEESYKTPNEKDEKIIEDCQDLYAAALEADGENIELAEENDRFVQGDQWSMQDKAMLREQNRACLTLNFTKKGLETLVGFQMGQRTDIHLLPQEGGDQKLADLYNIVVKHVSNKNLFSHVESNVFFDGAGLGRGWYHLYVDYSENIEGEIKVECFPYDGIMCTSHEHILADDAEVLIKQRMYSSAQLEAKWPEKAKKISKDFEFYSELNKLKKGASAREPKWDKYAFGNRMPFTIKNQKMVDVGRKEFRVLEVHRRVYFDRWIVAYPKDGAVFALDGWKDKDAKSFKEIPGFVVFKRRVPKLRITKVAGNTVLSDENPADLPKNKFFCVPMYGYKRGDKWYGKVEVVKDAQKQINKRASQAIDIGNRMASYGWFYDAETFPSKKEERKFQANSSKPGFKQRVMDVGRLPQKVEGTKFPSEVVELMNMSNEVLNSLMHVETQSAGANESSAKLLHRHKQQMAGNERLFDNLKLAKQRVGELLVSLIHWVYTPQRIYRLVANQARTEDIEIGGQPFSEFEEEDIVEILQNADPTKYDVVVSESEQSPTTQLQVGMLLEQLMAKGAQIDPSLLVELSPLPDHYKKRLLSGVQEQQAAEQEQQAQTDNAEITKTLIAQGYIPPAVAQEYGIQAPGAQGQQQDAEMLPEDQMQ